MVSENLSIQDVGTGELLNVSLLLVLGIIIAIGQMLTEMEVLVSKI